jgi:hypothetical protein
MTTQVDLTNITSGTLDGTGTFDKLLATMQLHIEREYDAGRLLGADYANVYVASIQAAMSQAIQFELTKSQVAAQTDLTLEQIETQNQQTLLATEQAKQAVIQTRIVTASELDQIAIAVNQKSLSDEQLEQSLVQGSILDEQALQAEKQTSLTTTQDAIATATKQGQIDIQANQVLLADEQVIQSEVQGDILDEQLKQAEKQTALITTQDSVATSVKQDQIDLAAAQTDLAQMQVIPNALTGI